MTFNLPLHETPRDSLSYSELKRADVPRARWGARRCDIEPLLPGTLLEQIVAALDGLRDIASAGEGILISSDNLDLRQSVIALFLKTVLAYGGSVLYTEPQELMVSCAQQKKFEGDTLFEARASDVFTLAIDGISGFTRAKALENVERFVSLRSRRGLQTILGTASNPNFSQQSPLYVFQLSCRLFDLPMPPGSPARPAADLSVWGVDTKRTKRKTPKSDATEGAP